MRSPKHVLIVGCGPAGAASAITARRLGMRVTVIDKAEFPRDKCCGDGLTTSALRLLEALGIGPEDVPSWKSVHEVHLRAPDGRAIELPLPADDGLFAAVASRLDLDLALRNAAIASGASVIEGVAVSNVTQTDNSISVALADGSSHTGDYLIAADGMWSPVRKIVCGSDEKYLGEWHAFRQYLTGVSGPARDRLFVWFEPDLLPGYAWSFPLGDGRVNLGYGILRGGGVSAHDTRAIWNGLFDRQHIREALGDGYQLSSRHMAWPIPAMIDKVTLTAGRVLFVGDAARAPDPMTGEGIGQALLTGILAAESIAGADPAVKYTKSVRRHLVADHRMSVVLGRLLAKVRTTNLALRIVDTNSWTRRNFARWMFEDEPRAIVFTPRRWHRKFLHQRGAYAGK